MAHTKRLSQSITGSWSEMMAPPSPAAFSDDDSDKWVQHWRSVLAKGISSSLFLDLIDSRIVAVDADISVEDACDRLLSEDILCLAIRAQTLAENSPYLGLFDFSDVNAFLAFAATRHTLSPDDLRGNPRLDNIVTAAIAGRVPVHLVSNLSDKNPLSTLPHDATVISLLEVFARGSHRVLIQAPSPSTEFLGMVSDRGLLDWFSLYVSESPSFRAYLSNPLNSHALPSVNIYDSIISSLSTATVLDAMKLMSEEGVSSIAVLDDETHYLLSAVSVTDIGKIVVPAQSNQILATSLHAFISHIKEADGSEDGADKFPAYSVSPSSTLLYTVQKLLTTNAHRVFVTRESLGSASPLLSPSFPGNLSGIVSIVDTLSVFARIAKIPNIDPMRMQRHRRASSSSSQGSRSDRSDILLSRSNSRTSVRRSLSFRKTPGHSLSSSLSGSAVIDK
ncbi:hypothetical protein BDN72DRAFT_761572 [Pluteus cervinus]|uniref:Uncharacterized protein n=1 Tax=Pluteus cervinus TaxID=181527 RepID=A0ACD3B747_9AGAR|nr:hypothetical protein BDN72DRAFT_761572 [Pluteus cervinus]